jgi:hypothetical protein
MLSMPALALSCRIAHNLDPASAEFGVAKEGPDAVPNHTPRDVGEKHYDFYEREREKRRALGLWDSTLAAILARRSHGTNVVGSEVLACAGEFGLAFMLLLWHFSGAGGRHGDDPPCPGLLALSLLAKEPHVRDFWLSGGR